MQRVSVSLAGGADDRSYDVVVGHGVIDQLDEMLSALLPTPQRVALITQPSIGIEVSTSLPLHRFEIGIGEQFKNLATVQELCEGFAEAGLTRGDVVVGVGGGMVTDVAGFAAASYHRGISVVHVPTTLLGMIDAAIGGKTGVNLPQGKNLVGAFWQPSGVLCDLDALATLPEREVRCQRRRSPKSSPSQREPPRLYDATARERLGSKGALQRRCRRTQQVHHEEPTTNE